MGEMGGELVFCESRESSLVTKTLSYTQIPNSSEGRPWYSYVDETVTIDTLKKLTDEYLQILERSPSKFKNKMKSMSNGTAVVSIANRVLRV
jgi:hypothetical protein